MTPEPVLADVCARWRVVHRQVAIDFQRWLAVDGIAAAFDAADRLVAAVAELFDGAVPKLSIEFGNAEPRWSRFSLPPRRGRDLVAVLRIERTDPPASWHEIARVVALELRDMSYAGLSWRVEIVEPERPLGRAINARASAGARLVAARQAYDRARESERPAAAEAVREAEAAYRVHVDEVRRRIRRHDAGARS